MVDSSSIQLGSPRDDSRDSSSAWEGLINDGKSAFRKIELLQFVTRHIRHSDEEDTLRAYINAIYKTSNRQTYCPRCKDVHNKLIISDALAIRIIDEFYSLTLKSFSRWVKEQGQRFQQGLHNAVDSKTLVPPVIKIIEERHNNARDQTHG